MLTKRIPKNPIERWVWIKGQLELRDESFASIARELKISRVAVAKTKRYPSARVEDAIARKLGVAPVDLWPERYAA
jgi:Ner family transcriptional regulator